MSNSKKCALFADLVFNEEGEPAEVIMIGKAPFYAIPDDDFLRHVEAAHVDRQIVETLQRRIKEMGDIVTEGVMQMMANQDLFTRPAIEYAIDHMDQILDPGRADTDELRTALWMAGFRAIVDVHGDLLRIEASGWESSPDR